MSPGSTPTRNPAATIAAARFDAVEQTVTPRDAMLYALGIGIGEDPLDRRQLRYVYERDLAIFPTMAITLCYPQSKSKRSDLGLDPRSVLHLYQRFELHAPIPLSRPLTGQNEIVGVFDKGAARGLVYAYRNLIRDAATGALVCTLDGASMSRDDGGHGGSFGEARRTTPVPQRAADATRACKTLPQQALLYRLSGDYNPFHVDPDVAREGGFDMPVLHGRCTFGIAGRALVDERSQMRGEGAGTLASMEARFTSPVFSGDTIRTEIWHDGEALAFRSRAVERDVVVLDQGRATFANFRDF